MLRQLVAATALAAGSCAGGGTGLDPDPDATFRVLFIGNSLTYTNDLPAMLNALADSAGVERTHVESVSFPNYALEDHWATGDALTAIRRGGWDYVIMQQGPSALETSRVNLLEWAQKFATEIKQVGSIPAMYTVWPSTDRSGDFDRVIESYALAAQAAGGVAFPAGAAWRAAWRRDPSLRLYGSDGFHPSLEGTYVAALTIFGGLYGRSTIGLPARLRVGGGTVTIAAQTALTLQHAADEVNGH